MKYLLFLFNILTFLPIHPVKKIEHHFLITDIEKLVDVNRLKPIDSLLHFQTHPLLKPHSIDSYNIDSHDIHSVEEKEAQVRRKRKKEHLKN